MPRPSLGGHFMDGFTASPQSDTAPPSHGKPAVAFEVAGQRPALPQVQGGSPANQNTPHRSECPLWS
ncbi:hypothetical protein BN126320067 [Stenotrophomonas maltophilia]|nr:hypothetical protein BN126320067 [Stenotrophomonas maltophilia]